MNRPVEPYLVAVEDSTSALKNSNINDAIALTVSVAHDQGKVAVLNVFVKQTERGWEIYGCQVG